MTFSIGSERYRLGGKLGDGATGVVRRAAKIDGSGPLAVKFLAPDPKYIDVEAFDDVASRFRREGQRGAGLDHPNLVQVHAHVENPDGSAFSCEGAPKNPFLLLEYVGGGSLESSIRRNHPGLRNQFLITQERLGFAIQIARALEHLHRRRIVHRDVKPGNIFLAKAKQGDTAPRMVKVGDFGVVKWGDFHAAVATGSLTVTSQRGLGTQKYMSPEQALIPKRVSVRSDMFSLGITLFELFTGQILPGAHHVFAIMSARLTKGNAASRLADLGLKLNLGDEEIAEMILDMHLRGAESRPAIDRVRGRLEHAYGERFGAPFPAARLL